MRRAAGYALLASMAAAVVLFALQTPPLAAGSFADEIARLSEPEGFFDTDNLISNERSYLEVVPALVAGGISGGAYIGVGPDQNFSYIARIRPSVAYLIDIRRDNLLLHLLFKALFARAPDRVAYLSLLTGRSPPALPAGASIEDLLRAVDGAPHAETVDLNDTIRSFGVPLSSEDLATIRRFHAAFVQRGLSLQFNTHGRPPQLHYPTLRDLIAATDRRGRPWHYLAAEADYQFVRQLQAGDLIVPVVGDVSGAHALRAIGRAMASRGLQVSAFYISNVESYLYRGGSYGRFLDNLNVLPRDARSVMIRSIFGGASSTSALQPIAEMLARR
jgi:hypothetical protein